MCELSAFPSFYFPFLPFLPESLPSQEIMRLPFLPFTSFLSRKSVRILLTLGERPPLLYYCSLSLTFSCYLPLVNPAKYFVRMSTQSLRSTFCILVKVQSSVWPGMASYPCMTRMGSSTWIKPVGWVCVNHTTIIITNCVYWYNVPPSYSLLFFYLVYYTLDQSVPKIRHMDDVSPQVDSIRTSIFLQLIAIAPIGFLFPRYEYLQTRV